MASRTNFDVVMVIKKYHIKGKQIRDVCNNSETVVMVTSEGRVYACDVSDVSKQHKYVRVNFPTSGAADDDAIMNVSCGRSHFLALSARGRVYSWGKNDNGQLGRSYDMYEKQRPNQVHQGQKEEKHTPRLITELSNQKVIKIACGHDHSLALTRGGSLYSWGRTKVKRRTRCPSLVEGLPSGMVIQHIATGGAHTLVVSDAGDAYVWGFDADGQRKQLKQNDEEFPAFVKKGVKNATCTNNSTTLLYETGELEVFWKGAKIHSVRQRFKPEMSQERTDSDCCFSSLTSSGRHTFLINQSGGKPLLLDTSKASECPRLDSLEETTFGDAFRSKALPEWPPGHDDIDIKLFKIPKIGNNSERRLLYVILHDKALRCSGSESGSVGRWLTWLIPPLPSFFTQFFQNYMLTSSSTKDRQNEMPILSNELLQSLSEVDETIPMETNSSEPIKEARVIFSSPACLNASFPMARPHADDDLDIDLEAARKAFKLIASKEILLEWIAEVVTNDMCRTIQLEQLTDMDLQFFFILLECPIFHFPQFTWCRKVLTALGKLLISGHGKGNVLSRLERWWAYEPVSFHGTVATFHGTVANFHGTVATYRGAISMLAENSVLQANEQDNFKTCLNVLQCLHEINIMHDIIDVKKFYLTHLNSNGLEEDLERFMQHQLRWRVSNYFLSFIQAERFSWLSYPFLIDLKTKAYLLESRCKREQKNAMETKVDFIQRGIKQLIQQEFPRISPNSLEFSIIFEYSCDNMPPPRLYLVVNRDDIFGGRVRQQLSEMLTRPRTDLQMPLMVFFEGEDGIDEGALSLEFFRLVFHDLLDPEKHDVFRYINEEDPTQSQVWFREECSSIDNAKICGLLLGLSLYNKAFVPIPAFPQVLYAKLLGKGPGSEMEELEELDKEFADQMKKLLDSSEEEVQGICYGEEIELDDGRLVDVTKENVRLYVEKKIRHYLAPSQFAAFKDGFYSLWDAKILGIFRPVEFEALINGENCFNWKDLEMSTRYLEPYTDSHLTIRMFWECFHALDDGQKRKFLVFVAGTDRVPVGGLRDFHLTIAELPIPEDAEETPEERLSLLCPMAHCCDNNQYNRTLKLPMYTSREMIEDRLGTALSMYNIPFHIA